jgi:hypothetical protein
VSFRDAPLRRGPQMRNCASGNLEVIRRKIPGSMLRIAPE